MTDPGARRNRCSNEVTAPGQVATIGADAYPPPTHDGPSDGEGPEPGDPLAIHPTVVKPARDWCVPTAAAPLGTPADHGAAGLPSVHRRPG